MRRQAEPATVNALPDIVPAPRLAPTEATRRWAALLQQIFEVDPLACPPCRRPTRRGRGAEGTPPGARQPSRGRRSRRMFDGYPSDPDGYPSDPD